MNRWPVYILMLLLCAVQLLPVRAAELDEVQSHLLTQYSLSTRWENVASGHWLAGVAPKFRARLGMHLVELEDSDSVSFHVPPLSAVRVHDPSGILAPQDVEITVSDGSGLHAFLPVKRGSDDRSLLVEPLHSAPLVGRVARSARCKTSLCVGVFVSRADPLDEIAPYRCLIPFPAAPCSLDLLCNSEDWFGKRLEPGLFDADLIRRCDEASARQFWPAGPTAAPQVVVSGPVRIAVSTRLAYPPTESRPMQVYRIHVRSGSALLQTLEYQTKPEDRFAVTVNGKPELLGQLETAYLEVPEGEHVLSFDATASLYLRLLAQRQPDFLLAQNAPRLNPETVRRLGSAELAKLDPWHLDPQKARQFYLLPPVAVAEKERLALRLVRDNGYRQGGLVGAMSLRDLASKRLDYPRVAEVADKLLDFHTYFADLLPLHLRGNEPLTRGYFRPRRLARAGEPIVPPAVPPSMREELLDRLPSGLFLRPPTGPPGVVYPIPECFGPSSVRLVAQRPEGGPSHFFVQFDDRPPLRLRIEDRADVPDARFALSATDSAFDTLPGPVELRTLGGPFASARPPAPLLSSGQIELPLPAGVKQVRVWGAESAAPRVAVQVRLGRVYRLSEMEAIELVRRTSHKIGHRAFVSMLASQVSPDDSSLRELVNHWQPLLFLLRTNDQRMRLAVVPHSEDTLALTEKDLAERLGDVKKLVKDGDWHAALPLWTRLVRGTTGEIRREAIFGRIEALEKIGEQFLADRLLRGAFLFEGESIRAEARVRLQKFAGRSGDDDGLLVIDCVEALRNPEPSVLASLTESLVRVGEHEHALAVGLVLDGTHRPLSALLRAAYRMRWWRLYGYLVAQLPARERGYWLAHRALIDDDEQAAEEAAAHSDEAGQALAAHLRAGKRIRANLEGESAPRPQAVANWMAWQAAHPGWHTWTDANDLVHAAHGVESVTSVGRALRAQFFVATEDRPLKATVIGPIRLKLEARPLHRRDTKPIPLDDWITIRQPGQLRLVAVNGNYPTEGLTLLGRPNWLAGTRVEHEIELGPGFHELAIAPETHPILVRLYAWRPEMPLRVLPSLSPQTVRRFVAPSAFPSVPWPVSAEEEDARALGADEAGLVKVAGASESPTPLPRFENREREAEANDSDLRRRMTFLVRLAEKSPAARKRAEALGQALFAAHPDVPQLAELRERLTRRTAWGLVTDVRESAGVRRVALEGWNPESPMLLARRSLLGSLGPSDQIVAGFDRFVFSSTNLKQTRPVLALAIEEVAHLPPRPLTAVYQLDESKPVKVTLTPAQPRERVSLVLPEGRHSVRVWIDEPIANQYLRVSFSEAGQELTRPLERTYQVATATEPLRVAVEGPAWVRIDERSGAATRISYRLVEAGLQTLTLMPRPGERETLFRVFRRVDAPEDRQVRPRYIPVEPVPVPSPWVAPATFDLSAEPGSATLLDDLFPLGLQDRGTYSLATGYRSRRPLDEDFEIDSLVPMSARRARPDEFSETRLTHRHFDEWRQLYRRTDLVLRDREGGNGGTLGLLTHLRYDPVGVPLTFHLEGSAYLQQPNGAIAPGTDRLEYSSWLRASVSQYRLLLPTLAHAPNAAVFGRLMSLNSSRYLPGNVDQDIFTPYKAAHQGGWVVADTLTWTPWLDTQYWGRLAVTSQENFLTPDNVTLRLGARQLIGGWEANASYRMVQFFPYRERPDAPTRHIIDAGLRCELWYMNRDRVELALGAEYELVRKVGGVQAFLTWHFGNGRGYRDFRPDEVDFLDLRRRR